jgi:hypothetical protein
LSKRLAAWVSRRWSAVVMPSVWRIFADVQGQAAQNFSPDLLTQNKKSVHKLFLQPQ